MIRIFFAGGFTTNSTGAGSHPSLPKLYAITFESDPQLIEEIVLSAPFEKPTRGVSYIRRFKDKQVLAVGCFTSLHVVEWTGTMFSLLSTIGSIHTSSLFS